MKPEDKTEKRIRQAQEMELERLLLRAETRLWGRLVEAKSVKREAENYARSLFLGGQEYIVAVERIKARMAETHVLMDKLRFQDAAICAQFKDDFKAAQEMALDLCKWAATVEMDLDVREKEDEEC